MRHFCIALIVAWFIAISENVNVKPQGVVPPPRSPLGFVPGVSSNKLGKFSDYSSCKNDEIVYCPCQEGFTRLASGKCYFFSFQKRKWHEALASCDGVGATLAYPMNVVEDVVLATHLKDNFPGITGWWLGGTDQAKHGQWVWVHNKAPINYSNWLPGQPDLASENCLHYWPDSQWQWNNINCDIRYPFVCQEV